MEGFEIMLSLLRRPVWLAASVALAATVGTPAMADPVAGPHVQAYGWGVDYDGQVGDGGTSDVLTPQPLTLPDDVRQIAAGGYFGAALTGDGQVWTWGANFEGYLGDGTTEPHAPRPVPGLTGIVQVSAGTRHVLALDGDGDVWSWGANERGQLGDGTRDEQDAPHQVPGLTDFVQVSAGDQTSLGLRADGTVWAWGANDWGELGDGTQDDSLTPERVTGLDDVVQVAVAFGGYHSVALRADGTVWGWGANDYGQLGTGSADQWVITSPVQAIGVQGATQVAAGEGDTLAVVNGQAWGWGGNYFGQLGDGTREERHVPAPIGPDNVVQVATGYSNTAVVRADGTVWAWGYNANGTLGTGSTDLFAQPAPVPGLTGVAHLSAGFGFMLALATPSTVDTPDLATGSIGGGGPPPPHPNV